MERSRPTSQARVYAGQVMQREFNEVNEMRSLSEPGKVLNM